MKFFSEILGDYVEVPPEPKIVSLAPSNTDILYKIGAWKYVYGVSVYCEYPEEAKSKPKVGSYLSVNYEKLRELNPNLILTTAGVQRKLAYELKGRGYNVLITPLPTSIYGILENAVLVASILGFVENAYKLANALTSALGELRREIFASVYFEADLGEPVTVGAPTFITSALYHIGLANVFLDKPTAYFKPDFKEVVKRGPEVIVYELGHGKEADADEVIDAFKKRGWGDLPAVKNNRVYVLPSNTLTHYGPSLIDNLAKLSRIIT